MKPVLIENASGEAPRQLMTASHHVGNLPEIHVRVLEFSLLYDYSLVSFDARILGPCKGT